MARGEGACVRKENYPYDGVSPLPRPEVVNLFIDTNGLAAACVAIIIDIYGAVRLVPGSFFFLIVWNLCAVAADVAYVHVKSMWFTAHRSSRVRTLVR